MGNSEQIHMGWELKSVPSLIRDSAERLARFADQKKWKEVIVPRPGCGNGGLPWEDVKEILEPIFDDRFLIISK